MKPSSFRTAWLHTSNGIAHICARCPDRSEAEQRAARAGLRLSHGTCEECQLIELAVFESQAGGPAPHAPAAVASTPQAAAARLEFLSVHEVAGVCGLAPFDVITRLRPVHWIVGRHYLAELDGYWLRERDLPDLVGVLSTNGHTEAARALWNWLVERVQKAMQAGLQVDDLRHRLGPAASRTWMSDWEARQP